MFVGNQMWIWEKPIEGHRYILGCDVESEGDLEDFTSAGDCRFDSRCQKGSRVFRKNTTRFSL